MKTDALRGIAYPEVTDPILSGFETMVRTTGSIRAVDSVAAARTILTAAEAAGLAPTPQHPAYFDIGGVIWRCAGKDGNVWPLAPVNEVEGAEAEAPSQGSWSFASAGAVYVVMSIDLGVRSYDRRLQIQADLYGSVSGAVDLGIHCQGRAKYARFSAGNSSQSVAMQKLIPAGTSPLAQMVVMGASAGASISVADWDTRWSGISILAFPVAM